MYDISFPNGKTIILVIETDSYAGNFERELCGFATGIADEDRYHGIEEANRARAADPDTVDLITDKGTTVSHDEYGDVSNTIMRNGDNVYNNVAIFLERALDDQEMAFVKQRAALYGEKNNITILDVYQIERTVVTSDTRL